jgi:mRNA-degrading endonuclease RelE of RelBE toxin-antitoxin system
MILTPSGSGKALGANLIVRVSPALRKSLEKLAEKDRRGLSDYVRVILEDHVARKRR